ncbi:hypothetical protein K466DRAFT_562025 [Polyporus arcularius HHB13444]|uniref:Uncharacterized protein n=1 Tax=Polyporus arcularius HHB13444 TaxID=1314778 RepID=A0A5C3PU29_9APHY|nr:hypothetical protein K466DRAFT_562025 [Polyporus arcularius HHB13444]
MNHPITPYTPVFARWAGYVGGDPESRTEFLTRTHAYEVVQRPIVPLSLGMQVTIYAVSPATYCSPRAPEDLLEAYDAHIVGKITKVAGWEGTTVQLEVDNECWKNTVRRARILIPYIPDATVRRLAHWRDETGPEVARDDAFSKRRVQVLPPTIWSCGAGACAMREPGTLRKGVLCIYWPIDMEERSAAAASGNPKERRKARERMPAIGRIEEAAGQLIG